MTLSGARISPLGPIEQMRGCLDCYNPQNLQIEIFYADAFSFNTKYLHHTIIKITGETPEVRSDQKLTRLRHLLSFASLL